MKKSFKKITLKNGLRVILVHKHGSPTTTALVLVAAGSKYETKEINGVSHFLEHLCFKGTHTRPTALRISSEFESLGAQNNAFTAEEYTGYYGKVASRHTKKILDLVTDLYLDPIFPAQEIEKEKGVIIEELNMYADLPMRRVQEVMTELLYGDQPAGWTILGRKKVIKALTRDDIMKYRSEHYVADATVVVVAGNFNEKTVTEQIERAFGIISTDKKFKKVKTLDVQTRPAIKTQYKKTDQTHLVLSVRAYDLFDKKHYSLAVLADILGGGMSSRLFQQVREKLGAAYYIRARVEEHTDHGYLAISAGVDHKKLPDVVRAILKECKLIKQGKVTEEEILRAKNHILGNLMMNLELSDDLALFYGLQETLTQKLLSPKEITHKINKVTKLDIVRTAKDIFVNKKLNLALIGPTRNTTSLKRLLKF